MKITIEGVVIDLSAVISFAKTFALKPIQDEDQIHPAELEIIQWSTATKHALYLCNEQGFPLSQVATRFHVGSFQFSAYLKSPFIARLHQEAQLELAEMHPQSSASINEAQQTIKDFFRDRSAEEARVVVEEWKAESIYPYEGEARSTLEE